MKLRIPVIALLFFLLVGQAALAADPFRLEINAVEEEPGRISVVVSGFDDEGKQLNDLTPANFSATLDDEPVSIEEVAVDEARVPTSIVLLVDVSGSMYGEPMAQAQAAIQEFVNLLDPADELAILAFSNEVEVVQDFTADRTSIAQAIASLEAGGETALFDAMSAAVDKSQESGAVRRLIVVLSDGVATVNTRSREASLRSATEAGIGVVAVGLGSAVDRDYLNAVTSATGGAFLEAATPQALRQAYVDLATAISSGYRLTISVPESINRTIRSRLTIKLTIRNESTTVERILDPLPGAVAPQFSLLLGGIEPGQALEAPAALLPLAPEDVALAQVEYFLDDKSVHTASGDSLGFNLEVEGLASGAHVIKAVAVDANGRRGEGSITFSIPAPPASSPLSDLVPVLLILLVLGLIGGIGFMGLRIIARRTRPAPTPYQERIKPWEGKAIPSKTAAPEEWPERAKPAPRPAAPRYLGKVVVMDEAAIRAGDLSAIKEYPIGSAPLTLGVGPSCDIQLEDQDVRIAMEEARLWVQKGRLVYHKLTTLSAMATEGVTSGWLLLADGEELLLGKYRILFRGDVADEFDEAAAGDAEVAAGSQLEAELLDHEDSYRDAPDQVPVGTASLGNVWLDEAGEPGATSVSESPPAAAVEPQTVDGMPQPAVVPEAVPFSDGWTVAPPAVEVSPQNGAEEQIEIDEETAAALRALDEASRRHKALLEAENGSSEASPPPSQLADWWRKEPDNLPPRAAGE